ncbi:MAG TPA: S8 family peptidase, partial [Bryobacteraceae bacterium]|nr:S8 family peptidase [Bryobacteraceae bacterium]
MKFVSKYSKAWARFAVLWMVLLLPLAAIADTTKISPDLLPYLNGNPNANVNVIIQTTAQSSGSGGSGGGGGLLGGVGGIVGGVVGLAVNLLGGVVKVVFALIPGLSATVQAGNLLAISNQSNVSYISLDRSVLGTLDYTTAAVNAPYAWNEGLNGSGVGIAIIDSGIYAHPDLNNSRGQSRVIYRQSFIGGTKTDDYGHGTHVAGIAAGNGSASGGLYAGLAPNANLIDLRVLDQNGVSNDSVVIAALEQAVKLKSKYNIRVINLSIGRPIFESCSKDPLCREVEAAWANGVVVVVAAGNLGRDGYATITCPGNSPHAITVGAMKTENTYARTDDQIASYSSKGPTYIDLTVKPDLVAPGNQVTSLLDPGSTLAAEFPANVAGQYFTLSGTSMATPVVSGTAALLLQQNPSLTPDAIKARLMKTAYKTFPLTSVAVDPTTNQTFIDFYDILTVGAGYVDVQAALNNFDQVWAPATSPSVYYNPLLGLGVLVDPPG